MAAKLDEADKLHIENLIDNCTLSAFLDMVADICLDKSEHILINWQDKQTASHWVSAASDLQDLARNKNYL